MPTMPVLAVAALIFYVFACANYVRAKCRDSAFPSALRSLIFSIFATGLYLFLVGAFDCTWTAYFGIPAVFALSAIPFKLMQDRSVPDDAESLS